MIAKVVPNRCSVSGSPLGRNGSAGVFEVGTYFALAISPLCRQPRS